MKVVWSDYIFFKDLLKTSYFEILLMIWYYRYALAYEMPKCVNCNVGD